MILIYFPKAKLCYIHFSASYLLQHTVVKIPKVTE